ncbi:ShlB/FhaC/HecB family hemolysin secretion/activation protein [Variovorax sp. J2P1-59]|uniref:ShlB/FhaC/HecB family hemolysin secretion/activation protein n=1 Tax=Variovorax flavidus TaxID=3053501 RepID=UPI002575667F|nr:ShlB/FhaC/HecB family hemolysin secretion/activation protein [Variovorax sp. J2P1-59]MDM0076866.1 ShlB/FhaC/HecB family hemolysin secretion/activation protein [Variovorax sp. J2P1-59]
MPLAVLSPLSTVPRRAVIRLHIASLLALPPLLLGLTAQAQIDPRAIDRQNQVIERQQQERLREEQERALQQAPRGGTDLGPITPQISVPDLGVPCRDIREIRISGASLLPDEVRQGLVRDHAGRCLAASDLEAILATLTKSYIDRGYITTRAYLPAQDLRTGVLEITVVEGSIERFDLEQSGRPDAAVSIRGAFPARPGDLLNLRDLEQGIDQLNSLASNSATLDVQPGTKPGQSVVVVRNKATTPVNLFATYDNLGTPSTGRDGVSATVSFDSLLGLNELIAITRRQSVPHDSEHNSDTTALRAAVPFGYNTFSLDASESNYVNTLQLPSGYKLASEGTTSTQSFSADRVVFRDQASRISLSGRLTAQDTRNFLGGEYMAVSSRKLSTLDIGATGFTQGAGGILNARLGYVRGLRIFGALEDPANLPEYLPHAQFGKFVLDAGFNRRFDIGSQPLLYSTQFSGQYTTDTLYGSQQILIGGASSVRGSMLNTLSGDTGYFWRNDLSLPWQVSLGGQVLAGRAYAGYDFGSVGNNAPGVPTGSMSGVTLGVAFLWRGLSVDLFASRAAHLPASMPSEGTLYSVRLSYSL